MIDTSATANHFHKVSMNEAVLLDNAFEQSVSRAESNLLEYVGVRKGESYMTREKGIYKRIHYEEDHTFMHTERHSYTLFQAIAAIGGVSYFLYLVMNAFISRLQKFKFIGSLISAMYLHREKAKGVKRQKHKHTKVGQEGTPAGFSS
jgi:hypothetical protein